MKRFIYLIFISISTFLLLSCSKSDIVDKYKIETDPEKGYKTLYFYQDDLILERVRNVKRVGFTEKYIIVEDYNELYFIIERGKDNSSKMANEIVSKGLYQQEFKEWLIINKINKIDFKFN